MQELQGLPANHRVTVEEGSSPRIEAFRPVAQHASERPGCGRRRSSRELQTWLLAPIAAPDFTLPDSDGKEHRLSSYKERSGHSAFLDIPVRRCCLQLKSLNQLSADCRGRSRGMEAKPRILIPDLAGYPLTGASRERTRSRRSTTFCGVTSSIGIGIFRFPATFLLNSNHEIEKVYAGAVDDRRQLRATYSRCPKTLRERIRKALPFPGVIEDAEFHRNYLSYGSVFYQRGYFEQAQASFERALADDPASAEALYGLGSSMLELGNVTAARQNFRTRNQGQIQLSRHTAQRVEQSRAARNS